MIGERIGRYLILSELGQGGMGVVYKAHDEKLDRTVALKFLRYDHTAGDDALQRFIHEARTTSALDHPNICTVYDIGESEKGQTFIAMAYYEGETLKDRMGNGQMPADEATGIALQIAEGLRQAHKRGIVHRDIKPANIFITDQGVVKILDFGLAKMKDVDLTKSGSTLGTAAYMSPEQARGEKVDHRTDIWSLGVILYEMIAGSLPFKGEFWQAILYAILNEEIEPLSTYRKDVDAYLMHVVGKSLAKDPADRYESTHVFLDDLKAYHTRLQPAITSVLDLRALVRQPRVIISLLLTCLLLGSLGTWLTHRSTRINWARADALPKIESLIASQKFVEAFNLAQQAERYIPDDPALHKMLGYSSIPVSINTTPPGSDVFYQDYMSSDADWVYLGRTPMDSVSAPIGYLRWRMSKEGFEPVEFAEGGWWAQDIDIRMYPLGTSPSQMVHVPAGTFKFWDGNTLELPEYWIDKYEVTNKEYKVFLDAGGYQHETFWKNPFMMNGDTLSWKEAMTFFRDKTGQPGPSTWSLGGFPEGRADYPVSGVSWYEAAAYAVFAGKSLPTVYHWQRAANGRTDTHSEAVLLSNFEGVEPARVGQFQGLGGFGTYDMTGNIKEWCWNQAGDRRFLLGGAWNQPEYAAMAKETRLPFDRSESSGFRCVKYAADLAPTWAEAIDPVIISRDITQGKSISDSDFQIYKKSFLYDSTALNPVIEAVDESITYWRKETVTFDAAYGDERIIAHLYLPKNAEAPYQTVIYYPTSTAFSVRSSNDPAERALIDFIPRTGRALVLPVLQGMYERRLDEPIAGARGFIEYKIQQVKDFSRAIDYLQTREDIDTGRLAYMGASGGGQFGPLLTAIEPRLKASVLIWGGAVDGYPEEVDPTIFAPYSRIPVLMINGRYDIIRPIETSQLPLFRLLGAAEEDKRHVILEGGHVTPMDDVIKETLHWLDRYLGPVKKLVL